MILFQDSLHYHQTTMVVNRGTTMVINKKDVETLSLDVKEMSVITIYKNNSWSGNTDSMTTQQPKCQTCQRRGHTAPNCFFRNSQGPSIRV